MSVASPNLTTLNPPLGRWTFRVDLSLSAGGRFSGRTAAEILLGPLPRSEFVQFSRAVARGVGGADHSLRMGAGEAQSTRLGGGDDQSARLGGGEDQSARLGGCGGPAPLLAAAAAAILRPAAGLKLEREGLSVRKLSVASSDLEQKKDGSAWQLLS
jgi:hypothetical protein